jgi:hypothetical protein
MKTMLEDCLPKKIALEESTWVQRYSAGKKFGVTPVIFQLSKSAMNMSKTLDQIALESAGGKSLDDLRRIQTVAAQAFANPVTKASPEHEEKEREYWQTVFDERKATATAQQVPVMARLFKPEKSILHPGQPMGYEEARDIFKKILQERGQEIAILKNDNNFRWMFTDKDGRIIMNLIKYFINDPTSAYPLNKAPFFYGGVGTGRSGDAIRGRMVSFSIDPDVASAS